ncbi:hypothetical protein [Mucilaginibacter sp. SG564]|uniref:hypothetical protein n=1 Tax=Mucilaginibacter sp. SG564 TaxID=2587022 RepID=UPI001553F06E|nr:hypothetical protein [Mucilaginibacter sp. SG564]NOW94494.1 hypothetical protein [Mucilaginibacter sp. SG564]
MPNQTNISYRDKGFWISESFIEVLSQYICESFEKIGISNISSNLQKTYTQCNANRSGAYRGMVDVFLDDYVDGSQDKIAFIAVLEKTKPILKAKGPELSIMTLNEFESNKIDPAFINKWAFSVKTSSLISTIDIIIQMLNGTWTSDNYSVYYSGFPNPNGSMEI